MLDRAPPSRNQLEEALTLPQMIAVSRNAGHPVGVGTSSGGPWRSW
ncbi:conserved hypothetical protein [Actinomyces sp. oral taxon 180 str. F0310]|nr:conserved hypothetical protein [Actinomyces sp. oral taxon 180 str. F0310]